MDAAPKQLWNRSKYPLQRPSKGPAQLSVVTSPSEHVDTPSLHSMPENTQSTNATVPWYRAVTDDQASNVSSHPSTQVAQYHEESSTAASMSQRSTSPASTGRDSQASSPKEEHDQVHLLASKVDQSGEKQRTLRRTPRSRQIDSPVSSADTEDVPATEQQPENNGQAPKESKQRPRQTYPLQSPASHANLQRPLTPPQSPSREPEHKSAVLSAQFREKSQVASMNKALGRQTYPLQSPASVGNLQPPPSLSPSTGSEIPETDEVLAKRARENEIAAKVVSHWRRQLYPVQSPKHISPFERSPTPRPPQEAVETDEKASSIHLPKNIRAVKDSEVEQGPKGRSIVVCLDGTGDRFDNDNSNIVHLVSALKKDDARQVTYYQAGIGTYGDGGLSGGVSAAMDMAVGASLGLHVRDAYHFLMHTYKEGDKICIFSFSRGAYTARCLAGMIHKVGLLPPRNIQQIQFAYEFYKDDTPEGWKQSNHFKKTFSIDVNVYFLGCFDSVASVGFIPRQLPLSSTPTNKARYFRHAMALDERRAKFKICRHQTKTWEEIKKGATTADATTMSAVSKFLQLLPNYKSQSDLPPASSPQMQVARHSHGNVTEEEYERLTGHEEPFDTDVLEVWFAGAHADIGGGAVLNEERHKLAQIPLRWMIRQAFECNTGIIFKTGVLAEFGLDVHTLWPKYKQLGVPAHGPPPSYLEKYDTCLPPRSVRRGKLVPIDRHEKGEHFYHLNSPVDEDWTPEQVEDFYDAMAPMNDQLVQAPTWWILEAWPVEYKVPTAPGQVIKRTGMNLGRYRGVEDVEPNLHWTALHRVQHIGYKIQARTAPHTTWKTVV